MTDDWAEFLHLLDPELHEGARAMQPMYVALYPMDESKLAARRARMEEMLPPFVEGAAVEQRIVPGPADAPELLLYIINADPTHVRPAIVHMHGGGFTASSARAAVPGLQGLAMALDCTIVTIEYRNAPEARFHQSGEDDYCGLRWVWENAAALGVDRRRIALLGESGGGGHAALLAIAARDRGEISLCFQALIYPMLDDRTGTSRVTAPHIGYFGWNADSNRFGWKSFLGMEPGGDDVPIEGVPARIADLSGLPPTFIGVGALDLFVEEDIEYARRLIAAGVPTELLVVPGAQHGFDMLCRGTAIADRFEAAKRDALRRAFAKGPE
jgi:acetyl esterase/lipase